MKQQLSIEVAIASGDGLLAQIAQTVGTMQAAPECFVRSAIPGSDEARIWMVVSDDETKLRTLVADLGRIPGVRRVFHHGPGQAIKEALLVANGTQ